jgi:hypothetical protein
MNSQEKNRFKNLPRIHLLFVASAIEEFHE